MPRPFAAIATALLLAACSTAGEGDPAAGDAEPDVPAAAGELHAVLTLDGDRVAPGDSIPLAITVVNATMDTAVLEFPSTQRYDLWVYRPDGESAWNWAMDKLFAQVIGQEAIAPADTLTFRDAAQAPAEPGEYRVVATITASGHELSDTATVTVAR